MTSTRTDLELATQQLAAIEAWTAARREHEQAGEAAASRELRLDVRRRSEVLERQHRALVERTQEQLARSGALLGRTVRPRLLVVHRDGALVGRLSACLHRHGIDVCTGLDNGAEGIGATVAEQPDLLLVEEVVPMVTAEELLQEVHRWSPRTRTAVQVRDRSRTDHLLTAGADLVLPRQLAPEATAEALAGLLAQSRTEGAADGAAERVARVRQRTAGPVGRVGLEPTTEGL